MKQLRQELMDFWLFVYGNRLKPNFEDLDKYLEGRVETEIEIDMKSNIFDKNGTEVKIGDRLVFPYVNPKGRITEDAGFLATVIFKYGCFGYETQTSFKPLLDWMITESGEYVSNCGNKIIYTEKYPFWVVESD